MSPVSTTLLNTFGIKNKVIIYLFIYLFAYLFVCLFIYPQEDDDLFPADGRAALDKLSEEENFGDVSIFPLKKIL